MTAREERRRADIVSRPTNKAPECDPNSLESWRKGDFLRRHGEALRSSTARRFADGSW
jgi:hypothetical protein